MRSVFRQLERIKDTEVPVLLEGESGSGKELVSHLIHYNGPARKTLPVGKLRGDRADPAGKRAVRLRAGPSRAP